MCGIYIHIPYCRHKCLYCDFYSLGSRNAPAEDYVRAVIHEARVRRPEWDDICSNSSSLHTLYIGGGTPSQFAPSLLGSMIESVTSILGNITPIETTVEVNPEDVTPQLCKALRDNKVNRISMGVQSFNDEELRAVGRRHTAAKAIASYNLLRQYFSNVSIDLIFGLPLQSLASWRESVGQAIALNPEHISAYSLMWEERTALCKMQELGKVSECEQELSEEMFLSLTSMLRSAGYEQYEISNYCKSGYRSRHNSSYWTGIPYIGLGASAHSYDGASIRRANPADAKAYIAHYNDFRTSFYEEEHLSLEELREEYIMTRLRRREGIPLASYAEKFGKEALAVLKHKADNNSALLHITDTAIRLNKHSVLRSDTAILALL